MSSSTRKRSGSGGASSGLSSGLVGKGAFKEKIVQMYDVLLRGEDPRRSSAFGDTFWAEFFLVRPKMAVLEAELSKVAGPDASPALRVNLNALFEECLRNLGEEHHIRVVYALQTLCGLVRAVAKRQPGGVDLVDLVVGLDHAERRMQRLVAHINE